MQRNTSPLRTRLAPPFLRREGPLRRRAVHRRRRHARVLLRRRALALDGGPRARPAVPQAHARRDRPLALPVRRPPRPDPALASGERTAVPRSPPPPHWPRRG